MSFSVSSASHEAFMQRALDLARLGLGTVSPNPMVGAVIVHQGEIIGEGWHQRFGGPHAEVEAIKSVKLPELLSESALYVTLEPCSHFGKTPPCADLVVGRGIKKVYVAMMDPNPKVSGKGLEKLRNAGIAVEVGLLEEQAQLLNKRFLTCFEKKRPYVVLKWAQTADGFISPSLEAPKAEKQISNALSQQLVHRWRGQEDAIMVGYNTLQYDNPQLNVRLAHTHRQPTRITWNERQDKLADTFHFSDGSQNSFVFNHHLEDGDSKVRYLRINQTSESLHLLLSRLWQEGIGSLIVEGGTKLLEKFISSHLWDEARICTSPKRFGYGVSAPFLMQAAAERFSLAEDEWQIVFNSPRKSAN